MPRRRRCPAAPSARLCPSFSPSALTHVAMATPAPSRRIGKRQAEKLAKDVGVLQEQRSLEKIQRHLEESPQLVPKVLELFAPFPQGPTAPLEPAAIRRGQYY